MQTTGISRVQSIQAVTFEIQRQTKNKEKVMWQVLSSKEKTCNFLSTFSLDGLNDNIASGTRELLSAWRRPLDDHEKLKSFLFNRGWGKQQGSCQFSLDIPRRKCVQVARICLRIACDHDIQLLLPKLNVAPRHWWHLLTTTSSQQ